MENDGGHEQIEKNEEKPHAPKGARRSLIREYAEVICVSVIFVLFSKAFAFQHSKIPTGSMKDTLMVGDHIIVNKFIYGPIDFAGMANLLPVSEIERGDVVVFKYPRDLSVLYIKRVIALPNEVVQIRNGRVLINGEVLVEPYLYSPGGQSGAGRLEHSRYGMANFGPYTVPPDSYFVMGDNRANSYDSRYWKAVPIEYIKGKAFLIFWSYDEPEGDPSQRPFAEKLRNFFSKVIFFFSKTRWGRIGTVVS